MTEKREEVLRTQFGLDQVGKEMRLVYEAGVAKTKHQRLATAGIIALVRAFQVPEDPGEITQAELGQFFDSVIAAEPGFGSHSTSDLMKRMRHLAQRARVLKDRGSGNLANTLRAVADDLDRGGVLQVVHECLLWLGRHDDFDPFEDSFTLQEPREDWLGSLTLKAFAHDHDQEADEPGPQNAHDQSPEDVERLIEQSFATDPPRQPMGMDSPLADFAD